MKKNKLLKSILSIFTGVTMCGTIPVTISSCSKLKDEDSKCYKLTFDAGEGQIVQGDSTVKVSKEGKTTFGDVQKPTAIADGKTFTGWTVNDVKLTNDSVITANLNIKANFINNGSLDTYCTITYAAETGVTLTGNTVVAIKKGQPFFTANRPTATKTNATFKYWSDSSGGDKFAESTVINSNTILYPVFDDQVTVTFGQPSSGTVTYEGPTTISVAPGTTFGLITRPTPSATNKTFEGWCSDASCTTAITSSTVISSNMTIYPKMLSLKWTTITPTAYTGFTLQTTESRTHIVYNSLGLSIQICFQYTTLASDSWVNGAYFTLPTEYAFVAGRPSGPWTSENTGTCGAFYLERSGTTVNVKLCTHGSANPQWVELNSFFPFS